VKIDELEGQMEMLLLENKKLPNPIEPPTSIILEEVSIIYRLML
jgi:hypothetical protein